MGNAAPTAGIAGRTKAAPSDARRQNRSLLLRALFRAGPMSRAALARASGLTPTTVSSVVGELVAEGMIEEAGRVPTSGVGKPATLVSVVADARHVVCLDLSNETEIRGAVVDLARKPVVRRSVKRPRSGGSPVAELTVELAAELTGAATRPVLGVGVSSPGVVDPSGVVVRSAHLGFDRLDLGRRIADRLHLPVRVANDAHAAALGELAFAESATGNLMLVRITEGIGAGIVLNHQLFTGASHAAGEIGHVVVNPRGEPCPCGKRGCLETVVTAPLLALRSSGRSDQPVSARAGRDLGTALAYVVSALNLDVVVLSGIDEALAEPFRAAALAAIRERTMGDIGDQLELRLSNFGDDDALLGAAVLILDQELGVA